MQFLFTHKINKIKNKTPTPLVNDFFSLSRFSLYFFFIAPYLSPLPFFLPSYLCHPSFPSNLLIITISPHLDAPIMYIMYIGSIFTPHASIPITHSHFKRVFLFVTNANAKPSGKLRYHHIALREIAHHHYSCTSTSCT